MLQCNRAGLDRSVAAVLDGMLGDLIVCVSQGWHDRGCASEAFAASPGLPGRYVRGTYSLAGHLSHMA